MKVRLWVLFVALVLTVVCCGCGGGSSPQPSGTNGTGGTGGNSGNTGIPQFSHVFLLVEENHSYADVIGNSNMPYLNGLVSK
ncbi:MAG: hypothetical protein ACRD2S_08935, partial [Terriglobales bacterium]